MNQTAPNHADTTEITWKKLLSGSQCTMEEPLLAVISAQKDLDTLWSKAFGGMDMAPEKPNIDFSRQSVVAGFLGMEKNGGHSIELKTVKSIKGSPLLVTFIHNTPGPSCITSMAIEYPYFIAVTDKAVDGKDAKIEMVNKVIDCN